MGADGGTSPGWHVAEPHSAGIGQRLNWLRAGVLGAGARWAPAIGRLVVGGAVAMAVTFGIGQLVGAVGL